MRVPPVIDTSSPMITTLSRTRPVTSVISTVSGLDHILLHDGKPGADHLREADCMLGAARVWRHRDDAFALEPEVAKMTAEQRQCRHVVDRDVEKALDLAGVAGPS